ncbi:MAG TPA: HAD-IIIC family phosphatase [Steroidobacteraceae bacterium]
MMEWLTPPPDFRNGLKSALAAREPAQRLEKLHAVAQFRLGFVETIQLDNALKDATREPVPGFPRIRLAILASSTVDHLLPGIRVAGLRRRLLFDLYIGSFGQYRQELLDHASGLHQFKPEFTILSLGCRETVAAVPLGASTQEAQRVTSTAIADLLTLWREAQSSFGGTVIQQTFLDVTEPIFGSLDRQVPGAPSRLVARMNDLVADAAAEEGVRLLDIARLSARDGIDAWFDTTRWLQGKMEIAPSAAPLYGEIVARLVGAQRGLAKKCLVLDLDNTLWGGVIGDVGLEGIVLGEGSAVGEAHLALQRYARTLKERGVVLAVCSKNDIATAEEVFNKHPEMLLKRSDITAFVANWTDKAENLKTIAEQLNIGLDSLVFVDDNPAERARVRDSLPMIAVPELPEDPAHYVRRIADAGYFEAVAFTQEDRLRVGQYAANLARESSRSSYQSMDDYLRGLEMSVAYGPVTTVDLERATQLVNKTNQFNTTTRRLHGEELAAFAAAEQNVTLQFRLIDRFGDNGLVSVMMLRPDPAEPEVLEVVNWVMSCRVFGRQLEDEAMNIAVEIARTRGARHLRGDIIATKKNGVISALYRNLGFAPVAGLSIPDTTRWILGISEYNARPTFINRRVQS